jgi:hypothetical protein
MIRFGRFAVAVVLCWALVTASFELAVRAESRASLKSLRFDCGPAGSPVAVGYTALGSKDIYSPAKGYGWEGEAPRDEVFGPIQMLEGVGMPLSSYYRPGGQGDWMTGTVEQYKTDLNRDGVISERDVRFRADVPNGVYRVSLLIGDLSRALGSIAVAINGKKIAERVSAWAPGGYRNMQRTPFGWWTYVDSVVEVTGGVIRIQLSADQSYFDQKMAEQRAQPTPESIHWVVAWDDWPPPYNDIGYPFSRHSLMALEIVPHVPAPVIAEGNMLRMTREISSPGLKEAITKFNSGDPAGATRALDRVEETDAQAAKGILQLWLAGRLEVENEEELVPAAIESLRTHLRQYPEETGIAWGLRDAETFHTGLVLHLNRGLMPGEGGRSEQTGNHFIENNKAMAWLLSINKQSPLYDKARLYTAIAGHMQMPYIPALGITKQYFEELEKKYPDNRHVRYYLDWTWKPHGDGKRRTDWVMKDYYSQTEGSPEWARLLQDTYATMVDWAEYWATFKQQPKGNIGGGWGDDVELVEAFGYIGHLSRGVSELTTQCAHRLVEGMWNLSEVDPEIGFCLPNADVQHSAEWTGNTLGLMAQIDYGNPLWIERSLKTAKLMRDLWTDYNDHGRRHFRANFLGATSLGGLEDRNNDMWLNYRAVKPALAVLEYNQNPAISKLFVEWADGWLAAAMSTERGKPRGVIPVQVGFPNGLIGGVNSPNWWTASHPPGTLNADWAGRSGQSYKVKIQDLFMTAYKQTGDAKYLEPLRLEYELKDRHGYVPNRVGSGERLGRAPWIRSLDNLRDGFDILMQRWKPPHSAELIGLPASTSPLVAERQEEMPCEGSEKWVAMNLKRTEAWLEAGPRLKGRQGGLGNDLTREQIRDHLEYGREMRKLHWPLITTQASATDRVHSPGLDALLRISTGGYPVGGLFRTPITYEDTTKYFAAAVLAEDTQGFRLIYHSMTPEEREIGVIPWNLEPNGHYLLRYGPDLNDDDSMDSVTEERMFHFRQAGTPIRLKIAPRTTYVIEVEQIERGRIPERAPDPGISSRDISYVKRFSLLTARVHNVGSMAVRNLEVGFYDGDPKRGGVLIARTMIPNIEAPNDLEPRAVTVSVGWAPTKAEHEIYVVVDPDDTVQDEITTFNNIAHATIRR